MGGYGQKCEKMPKSLHLTGQAPYIASLHYINTPKLALLQQ
jgi:hypothetical protein